jgi:hypothetical protein
MSDGFLARWSRRKALAQGDERPAPEPELEPVPAVAEPAAVLAAVEAPTSAALEPVPPPPPPTLAEAEQLTPTDDFSRFVTRDVDPQVRHRALKTLFTDPHFNVMDGLDTYIDDYGKPDPLPPGMLRQMAQSAFLGLFDDDPAMVAAVEAVPPATPQTPPEPPPDEDPDLRLQPHDDAGRPGPEPGAGEDAGGEH